MNIDSFAKSVLTPPVGMNGNIRKEMAAEAAAAARPAPMDITGGFGASLSRSVEMLDQMQLTSDKAIEQLAAGENLDIHDVMIATQETDIAFRLALAMRDKLVEAYQEVMRMAV